MKGSDVNSSFRSDSTSESAASFYASLFKDSAQEFPHNEWAIYTNLDTEREDMEFQARKRRKNGEASAYAPSCLGTTGQASGGIGFELLKKAGWKGSGGLGAREQGISLPLAAWNQHGRQGIGAALPRPKAQIDPRSIATAELAAAVQGGCSSQPVHSSDQNGNKGQQDAKIPKREWQTVKVEESIDAKVKRWRQVLQAEADAKAGKAIDRMMFRAFRDDSYWDTNPLLRRNNLSSSNPLL